MTVAENSYAAMTILQLSAGTRPAVWTTVASPFAAVSPERHHESNSGIRTAIYAQQAVVAQGMAPIGLNLCGVSQQGLIKDTPIAD